MDDDTPFMRLASLISASDDFQSACSRYHFDGGSSKAIACAALRVLRGADQPLVAEMLSAAPSVSA